jgi:hypothetical protein
MATLREYYDTDFKLGAVFNTLTLHIDGNKIGVLAMVHQDNESNAKFLSFYITKNNPSVKICQVLIRDIHIPLAIGKDIVIKGGIVGEDLMDNQHLVFTGRIFFYCESEIAEADFSKLYDDAKAKGFHLQYRGPEYVKKRTEIEKPLGFISHDTRDKDSIARPLAIKLSTRMCPIWFDEYTLEVGAPLRESIEKGIKECKKVILVLSPNFLNNNGWTKAEFNAIFTREIIEEKELILPIWAGVSKKQVYEYSPTLADRFGLQWNLGIDEITRKLVNALTKD